MEAPTLIFSVIGLIFAALAAWAALATVVLTRESVRAAEHRRIFEAVAAMNDAARLLVEARTEQWRRERFRDAQLEVQRAVAIPPYPLTPAGPVLAALWDPTAVEDPDRALKDAKDARWRLATEAWPQDKLPWYLRALYRLLGLRRD
jgi:hypothetical protein